MSICGMIFMGIWINTCHIVQMEDTSGHCEVIMTNSNTLTTEQPCKEFKESVDEKIDLLMLKRPKKSAKPAPKQPAEPKVPARLPDW